MQFATDSMCRKNPKRIWTTIKKWHGQCTLYIY